MPKFRHTAALLAPDANACTTASIFSASIYGGPPPLRPLRFAAARPATTRSRVRARSYCAKAPNRENRSSPCGVGVSIC